MFTDVQHLHNDRTLFHDLRFQCIYSGVNSVQVELNLLLYNMSCFCKLGQREKLKTNSVQFALYIRETHANMFTQIDIL